MARAGIGVARHDQNIGVLGFHGGACSGPVPRRQPRSWLSCCATGEQAVAAPGLVRSRRWHDFGPVDTFWSVAHDRFAICRHHAAQHRPGRLKARSAERLAAYYRDVLGLAELSRADGTIVLGAGERPLLVLEEDPAARADDPRAAGLFHTAFLLPSRGDLARWLSHAVAERVSVDGASDHLVSEAIYLTDPEGNGVEIYADRPRELWTWRRDGVIDMATLRLDLPGLVASVPEVERSWRGAPDGTVIGHVHLRVGEPDLAEPGGINGLAWIRCTSWRAVPCSCPPAATTTMSASIPGKAAAPDRATPAAAGLPGSNSRERSSRPAPSAIHGERKCAQQPGTRADHRFFEIGAPLSVLHSSLCFSQFRTENRCHFSWNCSSAPDAYWRGMVMCPTSGFATARESPGSRQRTESRKSRWPPPRRRRRTSRTGWVISEAALSVANMVNPPQRLFEGLNDARATKVPARCRRTPGQKSCRHAWCDSRGRISRGFPLPTALAHLLVGEQFLRKSAPCSHTFMALRCTRR